MLELGIFPGLSTPGKCQSKIPGIPGPVRTLSGREMRKKKGMCEQWSLPGVTCELYLFKSASSSDLSLGLESSNPIKS